MIDIDKFLNALKSSWIKRLLNEKNKGEWKIFYNKILEKNGGKFLFECNIQEKDVKEIIPQKRFSTRHSCCMV